MSGSDGGGGGIDEKKRRRMESNRESARRSRQRKQKHLDDLISEVGILKSKNEEFHRKIGEFSGAFAGFEAENQVLRSEKENLARRLGSLESMIYKARVIGGSNGNEYLYDMNMDPMMKPWQLPCPSLPIMASSSFGSSFNFDA